MKDERRKTKDKRQGHSLFALSHLALVDHRPARGPRSAVSRRRSSLVDHCPPRGPRSAVRRPPSPSAVRLRPSPFVLRPPRGARSAVCGPPSAVRRRLPRSAVVLRRSLSGARSAVGGQPSAVAFRGPPSSFVLRLSSFVRHAVRGRRSAVRRRLPPFNLPEGDVIDTVQSCRSFLKTERSDTNFKSVCIDSIVSYGTIAYVELINSPDIGWKEVLSAPYRLQ